MYLDIFDMVVNSDDFTAGGGSASALAGAMAGGMVSMVAKLSHAKPVNLTVPEYEAVSKEADALAKELLRGSEQDNEAYCMIKAAYGLPKETEDEKEVRKQAIRDAAYQAALVPKQNGERNKEVYELARKLEGSSNPNCLSDLLSAKYLSHSGVKGCILNIEANLSMIKDEQRTREMENAIKSLGEGIL